MLALGGEPVVGRRADPRATPRDARSVPRRSYAIGSRARIRRTEDDEHGGLRDDHAATRPLSRGSPRPVAGKRRRAPGPPPRGPFRARLLPGGAELPHRKLTAWTRIVGTSGSSRCRGSSTMTLKERIPGGRKLVTSIA